MGGRGHREGGFLDFNVLSIAYGHLLKTEKERGREKGKWRRERGGVGEGGRERKRLTD